jgi:hypothetical protein
MAPEGRQLRMTRFTGERWQELGPILTDDSSG